MKKIEFGFSNESDPKGSWQGIGIKEGLLLTDAVYYGAFAFDGNNFIVAKVDKDRYGRFPNLVGKFIVRDALVDVFADGSYTLFLKQVASHDAQSIETFLNNEEMIEKISNIDDIIKYCYGVYNPSKFFKLVELDDEIMSTSIISEAFIAKNEAIKNCHYSMSELQMSLDPNKRTR